MWIVLAILLLIIILYIFAVRGRAGHPGMEELKKYPYAHRGFHGNGLPENSMAAFKAAKDRGYGIELDIHLMKDGTLGVIHDSSLKRTAGADVRIEELTLADLENYRLEGTEEKVPVFGDVLRLYNGAAPIIVELKPENGNHAALAEAACKVLDEYDGAFCIESFDPRCLIWLKKHRPDIIRGQLAMNFMKEKENLSLPIRFVLTHHLLNFLTVPDFIAYKFSRRGDTPSNFLCRKLWGVQGAAWTIREKDAHDEAISQGWISIFENFEI